MLRACGGMSRAVKLALGGGCSRAVVVCGRRAAKCPIRAEKLACHKTFVAMPHTQLSENVGGQHDKMVPARRSWPNKCWPSDCFMIALRDASRSGRRQSWDKKWPIVRSRQTRIAHGRRLSRPTLCAIMCHAAVALDRSLRLRVKKYPADTQRSWAAKLSLAGRPRKSPKSVERIRAAADSANETLPAPPISPSGAAAAEEHRYALGSRRLRRAPPTASGHRECGGRTHSLTLMERIWRVRLTGVRAPPELFVSSSS
jgi:hypothetical protein